MYIWNKIKDWSGWSKAGSIFMMRLEAFLSLATAALIGMNWDALMALDFSKGFNIPVLIGAGILFTRSLLLEWVRRHNSADFTPVKKKK